MTAAQSASWREDLRVVAPSWLAARLLVGVGYLLAVGIAHRWMAGGTTPQLQDGLIAWDGTYYRDIASLGYGALPPDALRFFPLYPLAARGLAVVLLGHLDLALVAIANGCSFLLAIVMRRLVLFEKDDAAMAERAVWITALFPSAFVLVWAYAEGLFLLLTVGAFLAMRRRRWGIAAVLGFLAALTRPLGVLLCAPMLVEALRDHRGLSPIEWTRRALAVVSPALGLAVFLGWVGRTFGDAALPFSEQGQLRGEVINPVSRMVRGLGDLVGTERFGDGLHIPFALAFLVLLYFTFRRWPASYGVFAALVLLASLSAANLNSLERYGANAFPILLALAALLERRRVEQLGMAVCGAGITGLSALAWVGVYVP